MKNRKAYILVIAITVFSIIFTACVKKEEKPVDGDTVTQVPTQVVTITPTSGPIEVTPTKEVEPTKMVESYISEEQAISNIQKIIGERGYFIEVLNKELNLNSNEYYVFQISNSGEVIEPNIIVDKVSGELLCFNVDGSTAPFSEYPLYTKTEVVPTQAEEGFTKEDALARLEKFDRESLGLSKELSEYTIVYDNWTSYAGGKLCYGINLYSGKGTDTNYAGTFYVEVDGKEVYVFDSELDDFKMIK